MENRKNTILGINKKSMYLILIISLIFIIRIYVGAVRTRTARYLIEEYRFNDAMDYYNKVDVKDEEESLAYMYQKSDYNPKIYEYMLEKGYGEKNQSFYQGRRSEVGEGMWEDEVARNLYKYRDMDVSRLNLFMKLNIMARIDNNDEFFTKLQANLDRDLERVSSLELKYINYDMESLDHEFLLKEMKDKGIKSYFWSYVGEYSDCKYLVIGSTDKNKSYIYAVDDKHSLTLLDEATGIKTEFGFGYLKDFFLPGDIILSEFNDKGKIILLGFMVLDGKLEIIRWDLDDDIEVKNGKISSKKFNKSIAFESEKVTMDMEVLDRGKLLKIFTGYNKDNMMETIVIGEYKLLKSGDLEFSDFYLGI